MRCKFGKILLHVGTVHHLVYFDNLSASLVECHDDHSFHAVRTDRAGGGRDPMDHARASLPVVHLADYMHLVLMSTE